MSSNNPKTIKRLIFVIFIIILASYTIYNSRIFITGPKIDISEPQNGSTITDSPLIRIKGTAENIAFININDRPINIDGNAYFDEPVLLYPGYNVVVVHAKDKFERVIEKQIELIYKVDNEKEDLEIRIDENIENFDTIIGIEATSSTSSTSTLEEI